MPRSGLLRRSTIGVVENGQGSLWSRRDSARVAHCRKMLPTAPPRITNGDRRTKPDDPGRHKDEERSASNSWIASFVNALFSDIIAPPGFCLDQRKCVSPGSE